MCLLVETPFPIDNPLVTVIVVCYNHARFAWECLESVRHQQYPRVELIIVDDRSSDGSVEVIERWVRENGVDCVLMLHEQNIGLCRSLNEALGHASGKYVCIVATDDVWMPEKLVRQVRLFDELPSDYAVVYSDAIQVSETGEPLPVRFMAERGVTGIAPHGDVLGRLAQGNFIPAPTAMIRRSALEAAGPYDERLCYEDWDMWLRLASRHRFAYLDYVLAKYRVVASSLSRTVLAHRNRASVVSALLVAERILALDALPVEKRRGKRLEISRLAWKLCAMEDPEAMTYLRSSLKRDRRIVTALLVALRWSPATRGTATRVARGILGAGAYADWQISKLKRLPRVLARRN